MDSLLAAAARALAAGDVLTALGHVALRSDPPALALRGVAMAQLGELQRARELLRLAWRGFGADEVLARARCVVAAAPGVGVVVLAPLIEGEQGTGRALNVTHSHLRRKMPPPRAPSACPPTHPP